MLSDLQTFLKHELLLIKEMIALSERHHISLIKLNSREIEEVASNQLKLAGLLKQTEEKRLQYLMSALKISRKEAMKLKISEIEHYFSPDEQLEIKQLRSELNVLIKKLNNYNAMNRALSNRALHSVQDILSVLTNGTNRLCNVTI